MSKKSAVSSCSVGRGCLRGVVAEALFSALLSGNTGSPASGCVALVPADASFVEADDAALKSRNAVQNTKRCFGKVRQFFENKYMWFFIPHFGWAGKINPD